MTDEREIDDTQSVCPDGIFELQTAFLQICFAFPTRFLNIEQKFTSTFIGCPYFYPLLNQVWKIFFQHM